MNFLNPLAALFALVLPVIVLLYLLKLKRKTHVIPSTMLWRKSLEDLTANAPFQKLRRNILLYIQLLIAILLIAALMRPIIKLRGQKGKKYIVLLDASASMKTLDGPKGLSRTELARKKAREMIDKMAKGDTMTLISFANKTEILQNFTNDKNLLRSKLNAYSAQGTMTNISQAMRYADALARPDYQNAGEEFPDEQAAYDPSAFIIVISDGNIGEEQLDLAQAGNISFLPVGTSKENVGITDMDIAIGMDGTGTPIVFANVQNFGVTKQQRLVKLFLDEKEIDIKSVDLESPYKLDEDGKPILKNGSVEDTYSKVRFKPFGEFNANKRLTTTHTIRLALTDTNGELTDDLFREDDQAFGLLMPPKKKSILLVTRGNAFMENLLSLIPNTKIVKTKPDFYKPEMAYNITIFDGHSPRKLGVGSYLFLNCLPPMKEFSVDEKRPEYPAIIDWNRIHHLTRYVNFEGINIESVMKINAPRWARVMVDSEAGPLILTVERKAMQALIIGFDPTDSDWPLRPSYPIFFFNALRWLTTSSKLQEQPVLKTGIVLPLISQKKREEFKITKPNGEKKTILSENFEPQYFAETSETGFYEVDSDSAPPYKLALNLLSLNESDISPKEALNLGNEIVGAKSDVLKSNREIWQWLLWGVLAFLIIEWIIYCRRSWT